MPDLTLTPTAATGTATFVWTIRAEAETSITTPVVSTRRPIHPNQATATAGATLAVADPGAD